MELVYLWVEDYKNIHEQGFNFSPRFSCDYDDVTKELTIKENDDYIENFFGDNINVTAIVGKNGSGKSSVLKAFIETIVSKDKNYKKGRYTKAKIFLYDENNLKYGKEINKKSNKFVTIYWDYSITDESFQKIYVNYKYAKYSKKRSFVLLPSKVDGESNSKIDLEQDIQFLAKNILNSDNEMDIIKQFFEPEKIIIATNENIATDENILILSDVHKEMDYIVDYYDKYKYYYIVDIKDRKKLCSLLKNKDEIIIDFISKDKRLLFLSFGEIQLLKILYNLQNLITKITNDREDVVLLLDEIELGLHPEWQKKLISFLVKLRVKNNKKVHFILTTHSPFMLSDLPKRNIIFLDTYNRNQKNGNCKVLSHDKVLEKNQTFGANIHSLLSDSFFMEDGLMGEFAKNKIEEVVNFLQEKESEIKNHEEALQIIEIIGEPILKMKLRKMLENYKKKNNLESEDDIKKQIEELQKKLEEKKNNG